MSRMKQEAITDIPFELDIEALLKHNHLEPMSDDAGTFEGLVHDARELGRPKAVYRVAFIESKHDASVTIDGIEFFSRTLRVNLDNVERIFAYVATCGREIDDVGIKKGDLLQEFWLDRIKTALLDCSIKYLKDYIGLKYHPGKMANMSPGSGDTTIWPIRQQKELFSLLGNVDELIGVDLTDSYLMVPTKSISGILYPTEIDFEGCMLCHREICPSRRAPFNKKLWDTIHPEI